MRELITNLKKLAENTEAGVYRASLNLSANTLDKFDVFLGELKDIVEKDGDEVDRDIRLCDAISKFSDEMSQRFKNP